MNISRRLVAGALGVMIALGFLAIPVRCGSDADPEVRSVDPPSIEQLRLAQYRWIDPDGDPKGGDPVHIVDRDIVVEGTTRAMSKVYVYLNRSGTSTAASAEARPDDDGNIRVVLHLPEANVPYFVAGYGVPIVPPTPGEGNSWNSKGELVIYAGSFRVMFVEEEEG